MIKMLVTGAAFAALCATATVAAPSAQADQLSTPGMRAPAADIQGSRMAERNVVESQKYDQLLENNRGFRAARINKECGPITDPQLHRDCLASFRQFEPAGTGYGSSMPRQHRMDQNLGQ